MIAKSLSRFENVVEFPAELQQEPLEWEISGDDLWLRPVGTDVRVVWAYLGRRDTGEMLNGSKRRNTAVKRIVRARATNRFWRYWPLAEQKGGLFLRREFGLIRVPDKPMMARFNFRAAFRNTEDVLSAMPRRVEELVVSLEGRDDFQEALSWLQTWNDDWSDVVFEHGNQEELEALLGGFWALFGHQCSELKQWKFSPRNQIGSTLVWKPPFGSLSLDGSVSAKIERLFALLNEHIVVRQALERRYSLTGEPEYMKLPRVWVSASSMHNRMEGLLVWREFLCDKVALEELESLLTV